MLAGDYPVTAEKPVSFSIRGRRRGAAFRLVSLTTLIELKIASGMTAPHRLKDLADVIELIRANALPDSYRDELNPYVRERFAELWQAAQTREAE
jgi:hypothetical protein